VPTWNALLDDAAARAPERTFLVERDVRGVWHQIAFATVAERARRIGAALRALGASERRPVMILSGNGIDHALVTFGALRAGIPVAAVPPSDGLAARGGFARLRAAAEIVRPGVLFARDGAAFAAAAHAAAPDAAYVTVTEPPAGTRAYDYARLLTHAPLADDAVAADGATVAKIVFTADSGGEPRGVVTTHAMLCALLQGIAQAWPFLDEHPPVMVDSLPWWRSFGGNTVLGIALRHAGTLYVDDGDATPEHNERSARLRAEIAPTLAFDVPFGWESWVLRLRERDALRRRWLSRLDMACWHGATLAPATADALRALGVPLAAAWGAAETSSAIALTRGEDAKYDELGVPLAGVELKLVPRGDAYEARVRGAQVMNGYYWRPDLTAQAFDDEGFYRTGDLVQPVHARAPERGIEYVARLDGRFKLSTAAWVRGAELRAAFLAECSDAADVLVTGAGRDDVGVLVWPTPEGMLLDRDLLRAQIAAAMRRVARAMRGAPGAPRRALIVEEAPSDAARRALVARLHASEPDAEVIVA
jgi:feruloyl-CoA synthase